MSRIRGVGGHSTGHIGQLNVGVSDWSSVLVTLGTERYKRLCSIVHTASTLERLPFCYDFNRVALELLCLRTILPDLAACTFSECLGANFDADCRYPRYISFVVTNKIEFESKNTKQYHQSLCDYDKLT